VYHEIRNWFASKQLLPPRATSCEESSATNESISAVLLLFTRLAGRWVCRVFSWSSARLNLHKSISGLVYGAPALFLHVLGAPAASWRVTNRRGFPSSIPSRCWVRRLRPHKRAGCLHRRTYAMSWTRAKRCADRHGLSITLNTLGVRPIAPASVAPSGPWPWLFADQIFLRPAPAMLIGFKTPCRRRALRAKHRRSIISGGYSAAGQSSALWVLSSGFGRRRPPWRASGPGDHRALVRARRPLLGFHPDAPATKNADHPAA